MATKPQPQIAKSETIEEVLKREQHVTLADAVLTMLEDTQKVEIDYNDIVSNIQL